MRLQQLVNGWRGAERGEPLTALHNACVNAVGPGGRHLLPAHVLRGAHLDATNLQIALNHLTGRGQAPSLRFRVRPGGRFDAVLVPTRSGGDVPVDGKWYSTINGSEEDVIVKGVIVPFNETNGFSQISQEKVKQMQQQFGSGGTLLWFTSTSYDVGQDIWLRSEYYGLLHTNGTVQGLWYPPDSNTEGGTYQLV